MLSVICETVVLTNPCRVKSSAAIETISAFLSSGVFTILTSLSPSFSHQREKSISRPGNACNKYGFNHTYRCSNCQHSRLSLTKKAELPLLFLLSQRFLRGRSRFSRIPFWCFAGLSCRNKNMVPFFSQRNRRFQNALYFPAQ